MIRLRQPIVVRTGAVYSAEKQVQIALISLGYDLGPKGADGKVGPMTVNAIIDFKKTHGLSPADAVITDELMSALIVATTASPDASSGPAPGSLDHGSSASSQSSDSGVGLILVAAGLVVAGVAYAVYKGLV